MDTLSSLQNLRSLSLYIDIKSIVESKDEGFWGFVEFLTKLESLELLLTARTSEVYGDTGSTPDLKLNIYPLISQVKRLQRLDYFYFMIPETEVDLSNELVELALEENIKKEMIIDLVYFNRNSMLDLVEVSEQKKKKIVLRVPQAILVTKDQDQRNPSGEFFTLEPYFDAYRHFAEVHEKYYKRYVE